ncbi:MAG: nodulation protein NfeD [Nitrososphaerota archaeon]|nr:nodulation protein NfeD [Nitrososphaerota archaeon]MDG6979394.1 nodulation protein NfeD [Nitrososphaerota archaeon]MDG6981388.1 nodulation protein NfeD [Nitrososphaerota archaeon]
MSGAASWWRVGLALVLAAVLLGTFALRASAAGQEGQVVVVDFSVPVDPGASSLMAEAVTVAKVDHSPAIVIEMNTPGGLLSDMTNIISTIQDANQSGIPTYTYVPPSALAASAGSYIAMATNRILMGSGSEIGPSTPIVQGGSALQQNHTEDAMVSLMVSLAQKWGRNATAAREMVLSDVAYSASAAIKNGLVEGSATSLGGALAQLGLPAAYTTVQEGFYDQLLSALSDPNLNGILIFVGALAIVLDLWHPTFVLSVAGAVALVAGLVGIEVVGASTLGAVVILSGVALMFLELRLGHGLAMMAGAIVGAAGVYLLFQGIQYSASGTAYYSQVEAVALGGAGLVAALYMRWILGPLRSGRKLTGAESLVGKAGVAVSPTEVRVEGVVWQARAASGAIAEGDRVIVKKVEGLTILVEREAGQPPA